MDDTEKWTRFGIKLGHGIGGAIATGFGAGALVEPIGELEDMALDAAFDSQEAKSNKISPATSVRKAVAKTESGPPIAQQEPPKSVSGLNPNAISYNGSMVQKITTG